MQQKKQNFVEGAFVLLLASLTVKVIGALFQIPLMRMVGATNMGIFNAAYSIYMTMLVISSVGLPAALAKMVAESVMLGKEREARRIMRIAAGLFIPLGALCSALLFFGAEVFANLIKNPQAEQAIAAIAPSVLMVAILSVFRGYHQGRANMVPTAVSQVIEALGKLVLGLGFASYAWNHSFESPLIAASIVLGITIGEIISVLYMLAHFALSQKQATKTNIALNDSIRPMSTLFKSLLSLAVPITINSAVMSITDLIDLTLITRRLTDIGMTIEQANAYFGSYKTMAINFFNLPQTLIVAFAVSVLPAIAAARAAHNFTSITRTMGTVFRMTMLITLPAGAGFLLLSGPILRLVYSENTQIAAPLMQILGFAVPCVAVVSISNSILQALGRADLPLISMFAGGLVKLFSDYMLLGDPNINIKGAPISTVVCYALIAMINLIQIARLTHALPSFGKTVGRPLVATIGMSAATFISFHGISQLLAASPGSINDKIATIIAILVAMAVYLVLIIALHAIEAEDIRMLPCGEKLAKFLR